MDAATFNRIKRQGEEIIQAHARVRREVEIVAKESGNRRAKPLELIRMATDTITAAHNLAAQCAKLRALAAAESQRLSREAPDS